MSQITSQTARRIEPVNSDGTDIDQMPQVGMQKVQTQYTTAIAVQRPRDLRSVEARAMQEASILGADAFYGWGAGKDRVEGPSKELAMMLVRVYGNCAVDLGEVQETTDAWIFTAKFIDLETGFTLSRQFRQSKRWTVFGKFDEARKEDIRFQIGQSKAVRNVILNAVPGWLVTRGLDKAKGGVRENIEKLIGQHGIEKVQSQYIKLLTDLGATETRVLEAMGRKVIASLTVEDLVIMAGGIAALKSGAETVDVLFPAKVAELPPATGDKADALADRLTSKPKGEEPPPADPEEQAKFQASIANPVPTELTPPGDAPANPLFNGKEKKSKA